MLGAMRGHIGGWREALRHAANRGIHHAKDALDVRASTSSEKRTWPDLV
jgi:hypothetical protein